MIDTSIRKNINIRDKRISVIGLGLSGTEAAKLANHLGAIDVQIPKRSNG